MLKKIATLKETTFKGKERGKRRTRGWDQPETAWICLDGRANIKGGKVRIVETKGIVNANG